MRRITLWLFSTVAAVVLLFSYRTSTNGAGVAETAAVAPVAPAGGDPAPTASSGSSGSSGGKTYTGSVAQTRWGPVQVSITVSGKKITDVAVPTYPSENGRDIEINSRALPTLRQETLDAQSADIDAVSGATVTSDGYIESLQSALDAAHLS
ncbi:FMN-binding protein [Paractinoplanes toevensis]|uniref:FMN-binding protein n=1 Tax=Paractinoplanes toevensis TaxID=571911 RepID=A0A919T5P3_9ACTN|nr:FMN-binding protein [Actinoplanes toevensis]GIM89152.1 FMN-binding protein [Actinoplanes toevensis]